MKIDYGTIYCFDLTDKVQFGDMPEEQLYKLFQDGRVASKFLEHYVPIWFPDLEFVDQKGYDHVDKATREKKWDLKGFTKGGASFVPSSMLGAGRKINLQEAQAHARTIDYIFSDVTEFPKVRIQFRHGSQLVNEFPNCAIKKADKNKLFNGQKIINA
jgi:hypothetical protein